MLDNNFCLVCGSFFKVDSILSFDDVKQNDFSGFFDFKTKTGNLVGVQGGSSIKGLLANFTEKENLTSLSFVQAFPNFSNKIYYQFYSKNDISLGAPFMSFSGTWQDVGSSSHNRGIASLNIFVAQRPLDFQASLEHLKEFIPNNQIVFTA